MALASDPTYYNGAYLKFDLTSLAGTTIGVAQLRPPTQLPDWCKKTPELERLALRLPSRSE